MCLQDSTHKCQRNITTCFSNLTIWVYSPGSGQNIAITGLLKICQMERVVVLLSTLARRCISLSQIIYSANKMSSGVDWVSKQNGSSFWGCPGCTWFLETFGAIRSHRLSNDYHLRRCVITDGLQSRNKTLWALFVTEII